MINIFRLTEEICLSIFFPQRCVGCGKAGGYICLDCVKTIESVGTSTCSHCGKISKFGRFCPSCKKKQGYFLDGFVSSALYDAGPTKEMIHHLKYSGFSELSFDLAELIYQRLKNFPLDQYIVVPVPLHNRRQNQRGYNQSELLARILSQRLGLQGGCALAKIKNTESQVKLDRKSRIKNQLGAFVCVDRDLVKGKRVLLIDDVATTLATLNECARVLKDAGANSVLGAVISRRV